MKTDNYGKIKNLEDMEPEEVQNAVIRDENVIVIDTRRTHARIKDLEEALAGLESRLKEAGIL